MEAPQGDLLLIRLFEKSGLSPLTHPGRGKGGLMCWDGVCERWAAWATSECCCWQRAVVHRDTSCSSGFVCHKEQSSVA